MRVKRTQKDLAYYLKPPYDLIWELGLTTGLRISDILELKRVQIFKQQFYIKEQKSGKRRRIYIKKALRDKILKWSHEEYAFASPRKLNKHITRQAVWINFKKAAKRAEIKSNIGTHSMRKTFAYNLYQEKEDMKLVQKKLNHSKDNDTFVYLI